MAFDVNAFTQSFMQWYGIGQQLGARRDLNQMREQQPSAQYTSFNPNAGGMGGVTGYNYLGQQFGEMPTDTQMRLAQQQQRANIFEDRGLFTDARLARQNLGTMQSQALATEIGAMNLEEKKRIKEANDMLTKAYKGDVDAFHNALTMGAKYVTADGTPMRVTPGKEKGTATFQIGDGTPVTKSLSELSDAERFTILDRVRPGVLTAASDTYANMFQQDQARQDQYGLSLRQFKQQTLDAEKRFKEQVRQFNTTDKRQRDNAKAQQDQWLKQNDLADLKFDLAEEQFQHNRAMDLEKLRNNKRLIDARIKDLQKKLRPAEWQHNWEVIRNPNSSVMEFALAAGIKVDDLSNPMVIDAIKAYQAELVPIGPPTNLPNRGLQGLPQNAPAPQIPRVNPYQGLNTLGVPG